MVVPVSFFRHLRVYLRAGLLLIFLLVFGERSFSQKQANFWHFGTLCGVDFNSGSPVVLTNSALNTAEGCSSISDASGNLLFYTDGVKVWDNTNTQMPNGFGLLGDPSTSQSALIVPNPGNANLYYIFTLPAEGSGNFNYSVVDMTQQSGKGDVTIKNTFIKSNVTEKLTAVFHCNGHDIWVAIHESGSNKFLCYLVTNSGISAPVISNVGPVHTDVHGQMKFSTSGSKIALARDTVISATPLPGTGKGFIDLFDFNNSTGVISSPVILYDNHQRAYGVEFSPDDSKLYTGHYEVGSSSYLIQYDLNAANIQASSVLLNTSFNPDIYGIQLGPDQKVYVTHEITPFLDVVSSPNLAGTACNFTSNAVNLDPLGMGNMCMLGLPGFIQSYLNPSFPNLPCTVNADFQSSDTTICRGDCINFTDLSTGAVTSWTWTFSGSGITSSSSQNPIGICFSNPGTYNVQLIASNGAASDTVVKTIIVANPFVDAGANVIISPGGTAQLSAGGNISSYNWAPSVGLSSSVIYNPIAGPAVTTTYTVGGTDVNGCPAKDSVTVFVEIKCGDLFVPTGFSPNNDGANDLECIMGNCIKTLLFSIYDRWGEKVFETTEQSVCWDGVYNGKLMDNGIFVYYLKATLQNGEEITKKGNISLVR
jgi:gliding motility-associated-like protein